MYIARIQVENVRGFYDRRAVDLDLTRPDGTYAGWTVIAGRNGSGKTSLLRALALTISGPFMRGLAPSLPSWISADRPAGSTTVAVAVDHDVDRARQELPFSFASFSVRWGTLRPNASASMSALSSLRAGAGFELQASVDNEVQGERLGPWDDRSGGWFCAAYGPFRRLTGGSGDVQGLMQAPGPISRMASLFHEDASLAEGVSWLIGWHLRSLEQRPGAAELKKAALAVLGDGLLPDGFAVRSLDSEGLWVENGGRLFPLREMSDGYRSVAALVVDLLKQLHETYGELEIDESAGFPRVMAPGVVIIDEVDAHLHVSWQKRIGTWLKQHFPRIQFIVTTHSPYVCQSADRGGLIRLPGPDENEPPTVVDEDLYERVVYGSGDDAVLSELFGLDTPYSDAAQHLRRELVELEHAVVVGTAAPEQRERYGYLSRLLTSSPATRVAEVAARLTDRSAEQ
ncbi:AAA family ATPase [Catenuloplanes sp. NPDC051500]|uniref:AAA family ATPase n=1 Tax=Catenuloplanes sp. NPDC051500 TaxID=3363959 RepID=UPI00379B8B31